jgi:hypothetical protein
MLRKLAALLAVLGCVCLGSASASNPPQIHMTHPLGVIPTSASHAPAAKGGKSSGMKGAPSSFAGPIDPTLQLTYHNGPVMHSQNVHLIFWLPSTYNFGADASASTTYENTIEQYVQDVAAEDGTTSNPFGAITQYYSKPFSPSSDPGGPAAYDFSYAGAVVDTNAFPTIDNCPEGSVCLTDAQIENEVRTVMGDQGWSAGLTNQFAVILPTGVDTCFDGTSTTCSGNVFCAYHSAFGPVASPTIYLNLPYEQAASCHTDGSPQPQPNGQADVLIGSMSHEMREATSDPFQVQIGNTFYGGWWDAAGNESDDKCIFVYGSLVGSNSNQLINGNPYDAQLEWSNAKKGCYQVGVPTVSLDATTAIAGATVGITGANFLAAFPGKPVVKFNTTTVSPSAVAFDSPTHLTVTVPDANTTGKVTVQAIGGTGTSTQTFGLKPTISPLLDGHDVTGTKIEVDGTGFFGVKSVKFGTVAGVFSSVTADGTSLKVVVPTAAVTGNLTVQTAGGTSDPVTFIVTPRITSFTPLKGTGLSNVTINGTGLAGATLVDFNGDPSPLIVSDTATKIVAQVPDDATLGFISIGNGTDTASSSASFAPLPSITSLSVVDGEPGDAAIHVIGMNLLDATTVKFGSVSAGLATTVTATGFDTPTVPGPPFSSGAVSVATPAGTAVSKQIFQLTAVTGFTPAKAAAGATVTITGRGLSDAQTVRFGSGPGIVPTARTATSVKVVVPPDALDGLLTVNMPDGANPTTAAPFKPLPRILSFDHPTYHAGVDTVTVTGTNLQVTGPVSGKLGSVVITPVVTSPTSFHFDIPANAVTGTVSFTDAAGTTVSTGKVNVVPTIIGDPNPNHSTVGGKITINGTTFTGTTSVKFGADTHKAAFIVGGGGTTLTVTIPATALSGKVTVTNAGGSTQTSDNFAVDPFVKSFTPTSGPTGTQITVTGTGFTGANDVSWPGGDAVPTNVTPTGLTVVVPPGAATGGIQVFTSVAGVDANSEPSNTAFTVTMSATITTPIHGDYGSEAHFSGTGLAGVTEVDFNGLPGTNVSPSFDGQSLSVNAPASGSITGPITLKAGGTTITAGGGGFILLHIDSVSTNAALPGSSITITGTGFTGATDVTFGGADSAGFSVDSNTQITATVPSGETGTLSVVNGGTANAPSSFTIESISGVVINEVETDASDGFVELYNTNAGSRDLEGAKLVFRPAGATDASSDVVLTTIGPGSLLVANSWVSYSLATLDTSGGGIALELPNGTVVSSMGYGTATNAWVAGAAAAPAPPAGDSIARSPDGASSSDDGDDFHVTTTPTAGGENVITP